MQILLTGASGWIGYALAQKLAGRWGKQSLQLLFLPQAQHAREAERAAQLEQAGFRIIRHDLLDTPFPTEAIEPFDAVVHLAAYTQTETNSPGVRVNDIGTRNLLDALGDRLRGRRVIYTGSITSIDCISPAPSGIQETAPCTPMTAYGAAKLRGEQIIQELAAPLDFHWTILRLPTVYGPGYRPGGIFDLIRKRHPFTRINWPGSLSLLDLDDLTDWIIHLLDRDLANNELLHVADPEPVAYSALFPQPPRVALPPAFRRALKAAVLFILRRIRLPHRLFISGWRLFHLLGSSMVFDTAKMQKIAPLRTTPLETGLRKTWQDAK